ncbi:hypothetical protein [Cerasicoccus maritimus]|uniref:hypothetical protein n=1 Tax=Cerasicoccus maritimus TaxID=490089 RepID=UPI0028525547|nr:hypothetical protein [Cerasicoccus maritimus]
MKTIHINNKAKEALDRHAHGGQLSIGSYQAVTEDVWEITLTDDLYERLTHIGQRLRQNGLSSTFSDIILTVAQHYEQHTAKEMH